MSPKVAQAPAERPKPGEEGSAVGFDPVGEMGAECPGCVDVSGRVVDEQSLSGTGTDTAEGRRVDVG